jgi:hypothetical protein
MVMFADVTDVGLMIVGTLGAVVTGLCVPTFNILFGRIINTLNSDPGAFQQQVNTLCIVFAGVALVNLISGFLQVLNYNLSTYITIQTQL